MLQMRRSKDRGYEDKGWFQVYHTFSFGDYYDPDFLSYRSIQAINQGSIKGGKGLSMPLHKDLEILLYVIDGALEYKDGRGNTSVIRPGEIQKIATGSEMHYSEYNLSHHISVHFLEFWIISEERGLQPTFTHKLFSPGSKWGQWCLVVSKNGRDGSIRIHQDVDIYATLLDGNDELSFETILDRYYWVQVVSGKFLFQESILEAGDGVAIQDEPAIEARCLQAGEFFLFDLP